MARAERLYLQVRAEEEPCRKTEQGVTSSPGGSRQKDSLVMSVKPGTLWGLKLSPESTLRCQLQKPDSIKTVLLRPPP